MITRVLRCVLGLCGAMLVLLCASVAWADAKSEPVRASLCDYWPLCVGNRWLNTIISLPAGLRVSDRFAVNGFDAWEIRRAYDVVTGQADVPGFYVFVNGWLHYTPTRSDLDRLPEITGEMAALFPEQITLDQPVLLPALNLTVIPRVGSLSSFLPMPGLTLGMYPFGDQPDTLALISEDGLQGIFFGRGLGPMSWGLGVLDRITIVGGCDPGLRLGETPIGGWFEEGGRLDLRVALAGKADAVTYAWIKDGIPLPDGTLSAYTVASLAPEDSGRYSCLLTEEPGGCVQTVPVPVTVFPAGSLPAASVLGTSLALAGLVVIATMALRRGVVK